jgi:PTS system fructose-specific IIC component
VGPPVKVLLVALTNWLNGMQSTSALVLGVLLGAMMAFDMGGPVNKAAYTFAVGLLASKVYGPMAAVMAAGMTPPGLGLAATLFKSRLYCAFQSGWTYSGSPNTVSSGTSVGLSNSSL